MFFIFARGFGPTFTKVVFYFHPRVWSNLYKGCFLFSPEGLAQPLQRLFFIFSSILPNLFLEGFAALF